MMDIKKRLVLILVLISTITLLVIAGLVVVLTDSAQGFSTDFDINYTSGYKISFDIAGASNQSSFETITFSDTFTIESEPELPQIHNQSLDAWYTDADFTNEAIFPLTVNNESITLYPKFVEGTISDWIEWNSNGYYQVKSGQYTGTETNIVIPDYFDDGINGLNAVTTLAGSSSFAFLYYNTSVTDLWIGNNIQAIPTYFANYATALKSITIGKGVVSIANYAFDYVTNATALNYNPVSCTTISDTNFKEFGNNGAGVTLSIGSSVTTLADRLFYAGYTGSGSVQTIIPHAKFVGSIIIPDSVIYIGTHVFYCSQYVTHLTIGKGVKSIGYDAFWDMRRLESIQFNATECEDLDFCSYVFYRAGLNSGAISLNIGANVKRIPMYAFYPYSGNSSSCPRITYVSFEDNSVCVEIGAEAFRYCTYITGIDFGTNIYGWYRTYTNSSGTTYTYNLTETEMSNPSTMKSYIVSNYSSYTFKRNM